jgi:hypothetical protein
LASTSYFIRNETGEELSKKQAAQEATIRKLRAQACKNILCCAQACYMPVPLVFVYEIKCLSQFDQVCDFLFYSSVEARFVSLRKKNNDSTQRFR